MHVRDVTAGRHLFEDYSAVAERVGVYTPYDYVEIMEHLITRWNINSFKLSGEVRAPYRLSPHVPSHLTWVLDTPTGHSRGC